MVCNQLQYNGCECCSSSVAVHSCMNVSPSASYPLLSHGGRSLRPFHLDDVDCNGTESMLIDCGYGVIGVHNCNQGEEAGVICTSGSSLSVTDLRGVGIHLCNSSKSGKSCCRQNKFIDWKSVLL